MDQAQDELLRQIAALLPGLSRAQLIKIIERDEHAQRPPGARGPRPVAHAKARQIARRFDLYRAAHGRRSVKALGRAFLATLPAHLRPKPSAKSRGTAGTTKTLSNLITLGRELNFQRSELRRLVAALARQAQLRPPSSSPNNIAMRTARIAALAGRAGRRADRDEIEAIAAFEEARALMMAQALAGDAALSFVRIDPKK